MEGESLDEFKHRASLDNGNPRLGLYILLEHHILLRIGFSKAIDLGPWQPHLLLLLFLQHGRVQHALQRGAVLQRDQRRHPAILLLCRLGGEHDAVAVLQDDLEGVPVLTLLVVLVVDLDLLEEEYTVQYTRSQSSSKRVSVKVSVEPFHLTTVELYNLI